MNNYEMALNVPHFDDEKLAYSTLVVADLIEKVPTKSIGNGPVRDWPHRRFVPDLQSLLSGTRRWPSMSNCTTSSRMKKNGSRMGQ